METIAVKKVGPFVLFSGLYDACMILHEKEILKGNQPFRGIPGVRGDPMSMCSWMLGKSVLLVRNRHRQLRVTERSDVRSLNQPVLMYAGCAGTRLSNAQSASETWWRDDMTLQHVESKATRHWTIEASQVISLFNRYIK